MFDTPKPDARTPFNKDGEKYGQREILESRDIRQMPNKRRVEVQSQIRDSLMRDVCTCLAHLDATSHDDYGNPPSYRPTVGSVSIDPRLKIRLQTAQRFRSLMLVLPVSPLPGLVMHVECTQCPSSAAEMNSVDRRCV